MLLHLQSLDLQDNAIPDILPEVLANETRLVKELIARKDGLEYLGECKLLILGDAAAGKSCISRALQNKPFTGRDDPRQTLGIERSILQDDTKSEIIHIWDFGGQEIQYATHQFFLSQRSIYMLVVDMRSNDDNYIKDTIDKWYRVIRSYAPKAPIILILTHCDLVAPITTEARIDNLRRKNKEDGKFEAILSTGHNPKQENTIDQIQEVKNAIWSAAGKVGITSLKMARAWKDVKEAIRKRQLNGVDILELSDYRQICNNFGVNDQASQDELLGLLNDLGTVVYKPQIEKIGILDPAWATEAVYKIIHLAHDNTTPGVLTRIQIIDSLRRDNRYKGETEQEAVLKLIEMHQIAYVENETYYFPDALCPMPSGLLTGFWGGKDSCLSFAYRYNSWNRKIFNLLVVRLSEQIRKNEESVWNNGVILTLTRYKAEVLIRAINDHQHPTLLMVVRAKERENRRQALDFIRGKISEIHKDLNIETGPNALQEGITCSEMVSDYTAPDNLEAMWDLEYLKASFNREQKTILSKVKNDQGKYEELQIARMLDEVEKDGQEGGKETNPNNKIRQDIIYLLVFFSSEVCVLVALDNFFADFQPVLRAFVVVVALLITMVTYALIIDRINGAQFIDVVKRLVDLIKNLLRPM